jgi:integrase
MARTTERLTALKVDRLVKAKAKARRPGWYHDGHGLYLQIAEGGASWVYRYMLNGRARWMGLGSAVDAITLAEARERAREARKLLVDRVDPIERRHSELAAQRVAGATTMSFQECADAFIASHEAGWSSAVHRRQWKNSLAKHVYPVIGDLPVHAIDTKLVMKVVEPLWKSKVETASRIRGRIEGILDWAKVRGYRAGENPGRWRGHLEHQLPARRKVRRVEHFAAIPFGEIPGFMAELRRQDGVAARAVEFAILTAARSGETRYAQWSEFNLLDKVWVLPPERMKAQREHRVPLSARALAILQEMQAHRIADDGFVFPGGKVGRPLADTVLLRLLQRIRRGLTLHGFRSTFSDWAHECTSYSNHVIEQALAHAVGNAVERAYRRGDLFEKRRRLMDAWAEFCGKPAASQSAVISLRSA